MGLPVEFYIYVGYGLFAIIVVTMIISYLLGGFFGPFMAVKRSRGKKVLIRIRHPIHDYFRAGSVEEGFLIFKDREKNTRRIPMTTGVVSRACTVYWVEVDDEKNCFFTRETGEAVQTMDAAKNDSLYVRALYKPGILGDNFIKIILIVTIVTLLITFLTVFFVYKLGGRLDTIILTVQSIQQNMTMVI